MYAAKLEGLLFFRSFQIAHAEKQSINHLIKVVQAKQGSYLFFLVSVCTRTRVYVLYIRAGAQGTCHLSRALLASQQGRLAAVPLPATNMWRRSRTYSHT